MTKDDTLFDPATRERVRRDGGRGTIAVLVVATLVLSGVAFGVHGEEPLLARMTGQCAPGQYAYECNTLAYDVLAGILGLIVFGTFVALLYRYRRVRPTVHCESCGRRGWIMDLEPREGRCPRCAGSVFSYHTILVRTNGHGPVFLRVDEASVDGRALVQLFHETRKSRGDRYH
jgi:hypothetical protein